MNKQQDYTRITVSRADLFEACKQGFMAVSVGKHWCEGYTLTHRLSQLNVAYRID